ncbi:Ger(x)C family spore germination protein [Clostridiaceae bacterium M8S5]|nr:Ger(x)C family spore germination protein [Clostridiaceae bacterium M8S5]
MNKKIILLTIITCLLCTSCWNYKEIEDEHIVVGVSMDYDEINSEIIVNLEVVKPVVQKGSYINESEVIENRGKSFFDAVRNTIQSSGKRAFWSHCKVFIFSENMIKNIDMFTSALDFIRRDAEVRDDAYILISRDKMAKEIWETKVKVSRITSFYLSDMLENEKDISEYHAVEIWRFINALESDYISATLPTLKKGVYMDKVISQIRGTSVFRKTDIVGWLNGHETKDYLLLINELKGGSYTIDIAYENEKFPVAFEILTTKTKVKPKISNGHLSFDVTSIINTNVIEYSSQSNLFDPEGLKLIENQCESKITKDVNSLIKKVQREFKSDIFGFGRTVKLNMPEVWRAREGNWNFEFTNADITFNLEFKIKGSSLKSKPLKVVK